MSYMAIFQPPNVSGCQRIESYKVWTSDLEYNGENLIERNVELTSYPNENYWVSVVAVNDGDVESAKENLTGVADIAGECKLKTTLQSILLQVCSWRKMENQFKCSF